MFLRSPKKLHPIIHSCIRPCDTVSICRAALAPRYANVSAAVVNGVRSRLPCLADKE